MRKVINIAVVLLLFAVLASIRFFENTLFYDPLITFFKGDYRSMELPSLQLPKLMLYTAFRFWLNTVVSLFILWVIFLDKKIILFSFYIYLFCFVLLMGFFCFLLFYSNENVDMQLLFYVRRFLIQPLLVLLLIPAFYYYKKTA